MGEGARDPICDRGGHAVVGVAFAADPPVVPGYNRLKDQGQGRRPASRGSVAGRIELRSATRLRMPGGILTGRARFEPGWGADNAALLRITSSIRTA